MTRTKGNLAYVKASTDGSTWTEIHGINKITPKHNGNNVDVSEFSSAGVSAYKNREQGQLDWGISLAGYYEQDDPGQLIILNQLRTNTALYIRLFYDGTNYVSGKMVVNSGAPAPNLDGYVEVTYDMDGNGNATFGP